MVFAGSWNAYAGSIWVADCLGGISWLYRGDGGHRDLSLLTRPSVKDWIYVKTPSVEINLKNAIVLQRNGKIMHACIISPSMDENYALLKEILNKIWETLKGKWKSTSS